VFLNKPYKGEGKELFRVHRHTVPPAIPLAALAAKYLPTPAKTVDVMKAKKQNLMRFTRLLRREVSNYHNRVAAISGLRKATGLSEKVDNKGKGREQVFKNISPADAEAKQISIEWVDGRIGRIVMDSRGEIQKCLVTGEDGRDRQAERRILDHSTRIEDLVGKLVDG
jgi:central kinetochore subunit Mal2/MCM21